MCAVGVRVVVGAFACLYMCLPLCVFDCFVGRLLVRVWLSLVVRDCLLA